ncbi:MAG TPA: DinB family protein [Thermomicrobiales bacterium]|nr:DinB family protein [Thermomicrobiales bacterium]
MAQRDIYIEQVQAMSDLLSSQVSELDDTLLAKRPGQYLNPPGFLYFHILRVWDLDLNVLIGGSAPPADAWHRGDYAESMGYNPDGKGGRGLGIGFGYADAEVDEVPYQGEALKRYHQQLIAETLQYLNDANDEELAREITAMGQPSTTGSRVQHIIGHSWNHIGELRMTKSMLGFHDPTTPPRG